MREMEAWLDWVKGRTGSVEENIRYYKYRGNLKMVKIFYKCKWHCYFDTRDFREVQGIE